MIHLVSGKGGVGKSTVAAAMAQQLASRGRKTLLVEFGERSFFRHIFQIEVETTPTEVSDNLSLVRWEGEACLREYLRHLIKIETVVNLFFDNRVMKALVQAAPALKELALLGKVTSGPRRVGPNLPFDEIVVDAYATGHFRALWRAPVGLADAIPFGPMGEQSRSIVSVMKNPALTRFYVTMIAEDLPTTEGLELARDIRSEMNQEPVVIMNRWLDCPLSLAQLQSFHGHEFADYLSALLQRQENCQSKLPAHAQKLPWLFTNSIQQRVQELAQKLGWL
jgi:anion-transporting  ArsA/GET3 family ATPase